VNRTSNEITGASKMNCIGNGYIMRKDREEHCITAWSGGQKGEEDQVYQKQHGGGWLKMGKCKNPCRKL